MVGSHDRKKNDDGLRLADLRPRAAGAQGFPERVALAYAYDPLTVILMNGPPADPLRRFGTYSDIAEQFALARRGYSSDPNTYFFSTAFFVPISFWQPVYASVRAFASVPCLLELRVESLRQESIGSRTRCMHWVWGSTPVIGSIQIFNSIT